MKNMRTFNEFLNEGFAKSEYNAEDSYLGSGDYPKTLEALAKYFGVSSPKDILVLNTENDAGSRELDKCMNISDWFQTNQNFAKLKALQKVSDSEEAGASWLASKKTGVIKAEDYGITNYFFKK